MRTAAIDALTELAAADERIWLLTADLGYSVLERFAQRFPDRFLNCGVAEQNMTGIAAGLAHSGKVVFTYSIANFPTLRCLEQIRCDVVYHRLPVKVVAVGGGFTYGSQGYTHHGVEDIAVMSALPGMTVVAPGDPLEAAAAVGAVAAAPGPCYLRLGKAGEPEVHQGAINFELGRAIVARAGGDITLISTGGALIPAMETAERLAAEVGVQAQVLSMHTVKPVDDAAILQAAETTGAIVTVEDHSINGGLGAAVAGVLAGADDVNCLLRRYAIPDDMDYHVGSPDYLRGRLCGDLFTVAKETAEKAAARRG